MSAQRNLNSTQSGLETSMQRLSSGLRVNSARDDAAGLAIADRMNAQVRGMNVAIRNAGDAISLAQVAEGSIGQVGDMLQRMRELAVQSANGSNGTDERINLNAEFTQLASEVSRVITNTKFNGKQILEADAGTTTFQVGANVGETIDMVTTDISAATAGAVGTDVLTVGGATAAMSEIDAALDTLNTERAKLGAYQSRFESAINVLEVSAQNQAAARGRIMDADFGKETASMAKNQVLQQAGVSMLAQANQTPQVVLGLLG
jgi:flagellin